MNLRPVDPHSEGGTPSYDGDESNSKKSGGRTVDRANLDVCRVDCLATWRTKNTPVGGRYLDAVNIVKEALIIFHNRFCDYCRLDLEQHMHRQLAVEVLSARIYCPISMLPGNKVGLTDQKRLAETCRKCRAEALSLVFPYRIRGGQNYRDRRALNICRFLQS